MPESKRFLDRIRAGIDPRATSLVRFIEEDTFINMKPYSFKGHEFQQYFTELVQSDPNIDITTEKCSQIGLSEVCFRIVLGLMAIYPGYSIAYAMPSKGFAMEVLKTRIAPIINQSPQLSDLISKEVDSATVKMFKNESMLYAIGASANSASSLINRPVNLALTDELDKCDYATHTGLRSRQTHSLYKPRIAISTPTAPDIGINAEAEGRQVHYQIVVCHKCKKDYIPNYYEQVKIPDFTESIDLLTTDKISEQVLDTDDAYHHCPHCMTPSNLMPEHRRWVVDHPERRKIHVRLSPFDAPTFISASDLVVSQMTFSSRAEFDNQSLGLPARLEDATISRDAIKFVPDECPSGIPIAGMDLGKMSHYMKGVITGQGQIFIDHIELIPVGELEDKVTENLAIQRVISMVSDSLPFQDTIYKLTNKHPNFWGAVYTVPAQPQPELFKLKMNEEEKVRQVNIQKNLFMDNVAGMLASEQIVFKSGPFDETIIKHLTDMRRVRDAKFAELRYKWVKSSKAVDHFWHTLIYLVCASKLIQKQSATGSLPLGSLVSTFKNKTGV